MYKYVTVIFIFTLFIYNLVHVFYIADNKHYKLLVV